MTLFYKRSFAILLSAILIINSFIIPIGNFTASASDNKVNLASGAGVEVSSYEEGWGGFPGYNMTDGNYGHDSRWAAAPNDEHWIVFDLGRVACFDQLKLYEDTRYGERIENFIIEYWNGDTWVTAAENSAVPEQMDSALGDFHYEARVFNNTFTAVAAQKIRISFTEFAGDPAVREVEIFNNSEKDVLASSIKINGQPLEDFDPLEFTYAFAVSDGLIPEVTAESEAYQVEVVPASSIPGAAIVKVGAEKLYNAYTINFVKDVEKAMNIVLNAEDFSDKNGVSVNGLAADGTSIGGFTDGGWVKYGQMDFDNGDAKTFMAVVSNGSNETFPLELRIDSPDGELIGTLSVKNTGGSDIFKEAYAEIAAITGVHDLYIASQGAAEINIDTFVISSYNGSESESEKDARMAWWRDARYGQFIHLGAYANYPFDSNFKGYGEWVMKDHRISKTEYEEKAVKTFNPSEFDAEKIVELAKESGQKYIVFTSKHHEGYSMYGTKVKGFSPHNLMDYGAYSGKDPIAELSKASKEAGIKFGAYYSTMDWWHNTQSSYAEVMHDKERYITDMKAQLRELIQIYDVEVLWFDGEWQGWWTREDGRELYRYLRTMKPSLIINNRVGKRADDDGDFGTPEQEIPVNGLDYDWESCITMNDSWGYVEHDTNWKSVKWIIDSLVETSSKGGNILLNVGPDMLGNVPEECGNRMKQAGEWLETNGESIYGTTASPFGTKLSFGAATKKDGKLYLHVQNWPSNGKLTIPALENEIISAEILKTGQALTYNANSQAISINVPSSPVDSYDTVIVINTDGIPKESGDVYVEENLVKGKTASASDYYENNSKYGADKAIDGSYENDSRWATNDNIKDAWLEVDFGKETAFNKVFIDEWEEREGGYRIGSFRIEYLDGTVWKTAYTGTTVGAMKTFHFDAVKSTKIRLHVLDLLPGAKGGPTIWEFGVFLEGGLKDLKVNGETVQGFAVDKFVYNIELADNSIPVVSAEPEYAGNTCNITQASSIPGNTVVSVTTENGNVLNYIINFIVRGSYRGDVNNDEKINIFDIMEIRDHIFGKKSLDGSAFAAADVKTDGNINIFDIMMIRDHIFGKISLSLS